MKNATFYNRYAKYAGLVTERQAIVDAIADTKQTMTDTIVGLIRDNQHGPLCYTADRLKAENGGKADTKPVKAFRSLIQYATDKAWTFEYDKDSGKARVTRNQRKASSNATKAVSTAKRIASTLGKLSKPQRLKVLATLSELLEEMDPTASATVLELVEVRNAKTGNDKVTRKVQRRTKSGKVDKRTGKANGGKVKQNVQATKKGTARSPRARA